MTTLYLTLSETCGSGQRAPTSLGTLFQPNCGLPAGWERPFSGGLLQRTNGKLIF